MRIAAQRQTEMPDIVRAVGRLRLTAQDEVVDQRGFPGSGRAAQHAVEQLRPDRLSLGQCQAGNAGLFQESTQHLDFVRIGSVVHSVHAGLPARLQLLRGGDIRQDHEFLDQPMAVEPDYGQDCRRTSFAVEHDSNLAQVEFEGSARRPRRGEGCISFIKSGERFLRRRTLGGAVPCRLRFFIGQPRRRAHDAAFETVPPPVLRHLQTTLQIPTPDLTSLRALYQRRSTLHEHQAWATQLLDFRPLTERRQRALVRQVRHKALKAFTLNHLVEFARRWLYERRILIPADRRVRDLGASAR